MLKFICSKVEGSVRLIKCNEHQKGTVWRKKENIGGIMRLFINEGILKRKWNGNVSIRQKDGRVTLRIPNYDEVTKEEPYFEFIIPNAKRKMLKNNLWIYNVLPEETENRIVFSESCGSYTGEIYALLRSTDVVPDDIYISKTQRKNVKVLKRLRFVDSECDLGDFLSNVYFIRIKLNRREELPIYLTYENAKNLRKAIVFRRNSLGMWNANIEVKKISNTEGKYISLSEI